MTKEKFIKESIKRPGALKRLAKRFHAVDKDTGKIEPQKLAEHYQQMTTLQKQEFNLYNKVLRRANA